MKIFNFFLLYIFLFSGFILPNLTFCQIALNGIASVNDYEGSQPELITGVSQVPVTDIPLIRHVYLASPNTLVLIIDEKGSILSNLKPYYELPDDTIIFTGYHNLSKLLIRNGEALGYICGNDNKWLRPFDEICGEELDVSFISNTNNFVISSTDDQTYMKGLYPTNIFRKSIPNEKVTVLRISPKQLSTLQHFIYLSLPFNLTPGKHYKVNIKNYNGYMNNKDISFVFNDEVLRSESIHVNLYGYEPKDEKIALLSSWMGDGGGLKYPENLYFRIVNLKNGDTEYKGQVKLRLRAEEAEYEIDGELFNHNKSDVYEMDFSRLQKRGTYKLVIDGIGCSFDFLINEKIWENTTRLLMKGFFHQRAGIELGPPYTDYVRPRNLHPADGQIVHKCDPAIFFGGNVQELKRSQSHIFNQIKASIIEESSIPEAWGGWMDAGDFDRRMSHFYSVRRMMYLYELNPTYFEQIDLNIPESTNNIPDILDEALWCIDLFKRTQGVYEKDAVSWHIESIEHPREGEPSWLNSLPTALLPPCPEANLTYAATAAHMAILLEKYDKKLSLEYKESAISAMNWVLNNPNAPGYGPLNPEVERLVAYINLYRLTGDKIWHTRFQNSLSTIFPNGIVEDLSYIYEAGYFTESKIDAIVIYALMNSSEVDEKLQAECRTSIITLADKMLDGAAGNVYDILKFKNQPLTRLVPMRSKILPIVIAHKLTGNNKYINALTRAIQYTMGLNPMNRSYISGLGKRFFVPYQHDWHAANLPIPSGIPNFGPAPLPNSWDLIAHPWTKGRLYQLENELGLYPNKLENWPFYEACFDQLWMTPINEFMVETPMGELLLLTGYLASYSQ
jgi:endoglucanase